MFNWVCKYILPMWRNARIAELEYSSTVHWHTFIFMFMHAKTPPPLPCSIFLHYPLLYSTLSLGFFYQISFLLILFNKHTMAPVQFNNFIFSPSPALPSLIKITTFNFTAALLSVYLSNHVQHVPVLINSPCFYLLLCILNFRKWVSTGG